MTSIEANQSSESRGDKCLQRLEGAVSVLRDA